MAWDVEQPKPERKKPKSKAAIQLPAGCSTCNGRPFVTVFIRGVQCSDRCSCDRGQALAAKDRERW